MSGSILRRDFIKWILRGGTAICTLGSIPPLWAWKDPKRGSHLVIVKGDRTKAVRAAIDALGGMQAFVKKGQKAVLKPNMSFPNPPEWGTGTHPDVVATVARLCMTAGAKRVLVLDHPMRHHELVLRKTGILEACKGIDGVYVFAASKREFYKEILIPGAKVLKRTEVVKDLLKADVFINLPTAKSHVETGVSLGMKNLMGFVWDRGYFHQYIDLNQGIVDLAGSLRPDLTVMDATRALVSAGPSGPGKVVELNTIVAGVDPVAVDSYTVGLTKWYGHTFSGKEVRHILSAHRMGLGEIEVPKTKIKEIKL